MHRMTKNPRITITLTPSTYAALSELSRLTDDSMSSLVSGILDESVPVFSRMIRVLDAAQQIQIEGKQAMSSALATAQDKVEAQLGLVLDAFDEGTRPILVEAEKVYRRGRKSGPGRVTIGAAAGDSTPISNRGVRSTNPPIKTIASKPTPKNHKVANQGENSRGVGK